MDDEASTASQASTRQLWMTWEDNDTEYVALGRSDSASKPTNTTPGLQTGNSIGQGAQDASTSQGLGIYIFLIFLIFCSTKWFFSNRLRVRELQRWQMATTTA